MFPNLESSETTAKLHDLSLDGGWRLLMSQGWIISTWIASAAVIYEGLWNGNGKGCDRVNMYLLLELISRIIGSAMQPDIIAVRTVCCPTMKVKRPS
jgi:hypothetical protein